MSDAAAAPWIEEPVAAPASEAPARASAPAASAESAEAARDEAARLEAARLEAAREEAARVEAARRQGLIPLLLLLDRLQPGAADVGSELAARDEAIRFRHEPALQFTTGDVARVEELPRSSDGGDPGDGPRRRFELTTTFLGLTGAVSPLPQYLAEEVAQDHHRDENAGRDFLDLFHHRALSLLARGLLEQDPAAGHRTDHADPWSRRMLALLGVDPEVVEPGGGALDGLNWSRLRAAPLLSERSLTAAALEAILRDALSEELAGAPLSIEQFVGVRVPIAEPDRTRMGVVASTLGRDLVVGRTVLDRTSTIAVVIGPVGREGYQRFAVDPRAAERLRAIVTLASRGDLSAVLELRLAPDAAPPLRLTAEGGSRLGRDAWLGGQHLESRVRVGA